MNNIAFVQNLLKTLNRPEDEPALPGVPVIPTTAPAGDVRPGLPPIAPTPTPYNPTEAVPLPPIAQQAAMPPTPNYPIIPATLPAGQEMFDLPNGAENLPAITAGEQAAPAPLPAIGSTSTPLEQRLTKLDNKDYSIEKDAEGNITHRGKDRDKKWSIWDKIGSALAGWATGGLVGGVRGATDRNFFEKMGDENQRERLLPQIGAEQQIRKFNNEQAITAIRPEIMQREADRKAFDSTQKAKYNDIRLQQGDKKADNWMWAQEQLAKHREGTLKISQDRVKQYEKIISETERYNKVKDENADLDRQQRPELLGQRQSFEAGEKEKSRSFTAEQTRIRNLMTSAVKQYDAAVGSKKAVEAEAARARLLSLKAELEGLK